jgi:DNA (cytosine-5)-methyltransferase 1
MMKHGSLFSGIGGFDLAAEWMGWENVFHCEWMEFPRKVLDYYWPNADSHIDICKTDFKKYANTIDILTGGFPCQPFSTAGKRKGADDERYLWHEMLRAINEIKPKFVIAENVYGITNIDGGLVFEQVCLDLEACGYEVQPYIIPACSKNAPHRRDRVWFVAYSESQGGGQQPSTDKGWQNRRFDNNGKIWTATDTDKKRLQSEGKPTELERGRFSESHSRFNKPNFQNFPTQSPICGGDDGLPTELDGITFSKWRNESIKAYGNAIVPQVAYELFKCFNNF